MTDTVREFLIRGPYDVPALGASRRRYVNLDDLDRFWREDCAEYAQKQGCYIFGMRRGNGMTPIYIGRTTRSFEQECFTPHKYQLLHSGMRGERGSLVLYLLIYPGRRSKALVDRLSSELEQFLIANAAAKNPDLLNIRGRKRSQINAGIEGIYRSETAPTQDQVAFRVSMGLPPAR